MLGLVLQPNRLANTVRRYIGIHNFHHIKTYVFKQTNSSRLADNIRPYGFATFIKYVFTYILYFYLPANRVRRYK